MACINIILLIATGLLPLPSVEAVSFQALEDSYADSGSPSSNFGTSSTLRVDSSPTVQRTFTRFQVQGVTVPVSSAQLTFTCTNSGPAGTVWTTGGSWTEQSLTWNNQPDLLNPISSPGNFSCSLSGTLVVYDVTSIVTGDGTYDFAVATSSTDGLAFRSRETSSGPALVINAPISSGSPDVDQVHLSWTGNPATTMTVMWHTQSSSNSAQVQYETATGSGSTANGKTYPSSGQGYLHEVTLTGLQPATRYNYRVSADDRSWSSDYSFQTAPLGDGNFRFLAVADMGRNTNSITISNLMARQAASFTVGAGDYWYSDDEDNVDSWFNINQPLMSQAPFMPARGNHEGGNHETAYPNRYPTRFALPPPENYYSFRYGAAHFLIVDTNVDYTSGSVQGNFIERDLQAAASDPAVKWTFAVHHHPPFSSSTFQSLTARGQLSPLYDRYGVDVVITGHAHLYERTFPVMADGTVASTDPSEYVNPEAPIYMVTGGGGASPPPGQIKCSSDPQSWSVKCLEVFEFLEFHTTPTSVELSAIGIDGLVFDRFTLRRTDPATDILTMFPSDDAYIRAHSPDSNFGMATTLQADRSPVKNFLLKFYVTGVGIRQVTSARLRLFAVDPSGNGGDFYRTADTWNQDTVTWRNAPVSDTVRIASLGSVSTGVWYEIDITFVVVGDGVVSLRVSSPSTNGADYSSKEGANSPQLVIRLSN